ncbi:hypothetical protein [Dyella sp. C11]|uniref:hypothetical protein n=1 Tax=Dyella sp. C11 TaxID=2126991 RepID=UPI000D65C91A|nr:hypothetical protein [Dyella sp. C11]
MAVSLAWLAIAATAKDAPTGMLDGVTFTQVSPLSGSAELARRLVTPLNARRLQQQASAHGVALADQPVDPSREHFVLYVPANAPPGGYALLVFVPPWNDARLPPGWAPVLDRHGMILVTAAGIGNDANVLDRRDPVSLLGAINVMARYPVNPQRVYIGGFSGGSRVALRLALGYADLFRGALLDAGSDTIGDTIPLPPSALLQAFQAGTRLVYLTGADDPARQDADRRSLQSLRDWCIEDVDRRAMPRTGHDLADPASLDRALTSLETHHAPDAARLAACRAHVVDAMNQQLDEADAALKTGHADQARTLLESIDHRYGGLAAPRSMALAAQLEQAAPPSP